MNGEVEMKNFSLRYRDDSPLVLNNCSIKIESGQKIGVVGRTGAGKSTLCNAFTRVVEKESGHIYFDGVDISEVNLRQLRESITIVTQDPTMYKGSLQYNLDPTGKIPRQETLALLKKANLHEIILKKVQEQKSKGVSASQQEQATTKEQDDAQIEEKQGSLDNQLLNFEINDNLSSGEKSLVQICRAILRRTKIVIMDEATANIDIETEKTIQTLISEELKHCTVLTIAHRLQTIINSDKVLVMSSG